MATTPLRQFGDWRELVLCGAVLFCGCAVDRTSMTMDSVSRRPFFGIELAPKKKKSPVYERSIAQDRRRAEDTPQIQPAIRESQRDNQWPQWLTLPSSRPTLPLPRTDLAVETRPATQTASSTASQPIEF